MTHEFECVLGRFRYWQNQLEIAVRNEDRQRLVECGRVIEEYGILIARMSQQAALAEPRDNVEAGARAT